MMRKTCLHLEPEDRKLLEDLFQKYAPGIEVWAYGSRVTGQSHDASDLDLALRTPDLKRMEASQLNALRNGLTESAVPFLTEIRDWAALPKSFQNEIEKNHIVLIPAGK